MQLHTYLNYGGNCQEAFRFYEQHLGAKIGMMMTHDQMPGGAPVAPELKGKVLHAKLTLAGRDVMASDVPPDRFQPMRSVYLSLSVESSEKAESLFKLLSDAGEVFMPIAETFFAHRFGMLRDKFGTSWMILHEKPMGPG